MHRRRPGRLLPVNSPNPYRDLPGVDELASRLEGELPWPLKVEAARSGIEEARHALASGRDGDPDAGARRIVEALERSKGVRVINASGVLLHTNLGRARWSDRAIAGGSRAAGHHTNLEIDLEDGARLGRGEYAAALLSELTGAEDAMVVNNNAGAIVLALAALSSGRAVPVSRGELIEIGGAYRLPDVMKASGARLVEVGTTNRTRIGDYQTALQTHRCGAVLKVHPSNYRVHGFSSEADVAELSRLARSAGVPLVHDIGSGLLDEQVPWLHGRLPAWLAGEPGARQSLDQGAHLVTFSGDKLLGGPQSGIVAGDRSVVSLLRSHPLARALRVDGVTLGALGATLEAFASNDVSEIPFWRQALADQAPIRERAIVMAGVVGGEVVEGMSAVGAGSAPGGEIPSAHLVLAGEDALYERLLGGTPAILARRAHGSLVIDLRTVDPIDDEMVASQLLRCR